MPPDRLDAPVSPDTGEPLSTTDTTGGASHTSTSRDERHDLCPTAEQCEACAGYLPCSSAACRTRGLVHFPPAAGALGSELRRVRCDCDGYPRVPHREEFRT